MSSQPLPYFSSLVNSDFEGADPLRIEANLLGDAQLPADDHKQILASYTERLKKLESATGMSMSSYSSPGGDAPSPPRVRSGAAEGARSTEYSFKPTPAPPPRPSVSGGGGLGGDFDSFGASASGAGDDDSSGSDSDDDGSDGSESGSASSEDGPSRPFREAAHRMHLDPYGDDTGPRDRMSIDSMILDIDLYRRHLTTAGEDITNIPNVSAASSYADVRRVHNILTALYASAHYATVFEDIVLGGTRLLETVFDGSLKVLGKYPINYAGLTRTLSVKFSQNRRAVANAATKVASNYGISPETIVLFSLLLPFVTVPIKNMGDSTGPIHNANISQVLNQ